jgi:hypothetical protein
MTNDAAIKTGLPIKRAGLRFSVTRGPDQTSGDNAIAQVNNAAGARDQW